MDQAAALEAVGAATVRIRQDQVLSVWEKKRDVWKIIFHIF